MNIGIDADSNSWGSDYDQGEEYGSEFSDGEFQQSGGVGGGSGGHGSGVAQHHFHASQPGRAASKSKGAAAHGRKTVNRGRWTKDEVSKLPAFPEKAPSAASVWRE